ncbi:hypothetical protein WJX73_002476 [Symbiochloris irregularis]|uniref:Ubiquitin-like domain-containing protein n=1 Tax=Symbiochloris irregularis TaxID=706552 RepID=A0AAW1Q404_9CHLO
MKLRGQATRLPSGSQVVVEPAEYFAALKKRIFEKEGVPVENQRLLFAVPAAAESPRASQSPAAQATAEDLLSGDLSHWQVILFRDNKAIGRLVTPQALTAADSSSPGHADENGQEVDGLLSVKFDRFQPCASRQTAVHLAPPLRLPCDAEFLNSTYRLQVFVSQGGSGPSVALPRCVYSFTVPTGEDLLLDQGAGFQNFSLVLEDPGAVPAALKSVILHFILVACSFLDDAQTKELHQTHTGQSLGLRTSMSSSGEITSTELRSAAQKDAARQPRAPVNHHSLAAQSHSEGQSEGQSLGRQTSSSRASRAGRAKSDRSSSKPLRNDTGDASRHDSQPAKLTRPLCLGDIWELFEEADMHGQPIFARGGPRGSSMLYYTPVLSAAFLHANASPPNSPASQDDAELGQEAPSLINFEFIDDEKKPWERLNMSEMMERLTSTRPELLQTPLASLHPHSWFAVQWTPRLRIPDAPTGTKFLIYYSCLPQPLTNTHYGTMSYIPHVTLQPFRQPGQPFRQPGEPVQWVLPIVGMLWASGVKEQWWGLPQVPSEDASTDRLQPDAAPMPEQLQQLLTCLKESARQLSGGLHERHRDFEELRSGGP